MKLHEILEKHVKKPIKRPCFQGWVELLGPNNRHSDHPIFVWENSEDGWKAFCPDDILADDWIVKLDEVETFDVKELQDKINQLEARIILLEARPSLSFGTTPCISPPINNELICFDGTPHTYPNPWMATVPPHCTKCGKQSGSYCTFTYTSGNTTTSNIDGSVQTIKG